MKANTNPFRAAARLCGIAGRALSAAGLLCLLAAPPRAVAADAADAVRAFLAKQGIPEGYDAARDRFVFVGDCAREMPTLDGPDFVQVRERAFLVAVLSAKRELIETLGRNVSAEESVRVEDRDGETEQTATSVVEIFARRLVRGCTVLRAEESYGGGIYRTAVAVAWSEKLEGAALAALSGDDGGTTPAENDAEWEAWAKRTDFARRIGPAQFTDARGVYRYAGIGCADIEGKTGKALLGAVKVAETKAEQSLVYSIWADTVAHDRAVAILRERASGGGEEAVAAEDFVSRIAQGCAGRHVRRRKVFAGEVRNPLTGRRMYVFVAGVDPAVLAEIRDSED